MKHRKFKINRNNSVVLLVTVIFFFIININFVKGCVTPYENMQITQDTTFCSGVYNLSDSDANGAIQIAADGVTLDCNGTTIIGNMAVNSKAISSWNNNNIIIKNCILYNYGQGIYIGASSNVLVIKNEFKNISNVAISLDYPQYSQFSENIIKNCNKGMIFHYTDLTTGNNIISENIFNGTKDTAISITATGQNVYNNIFENNGGTFPIDMMDAYNTNIANNTIINTTFRIRASGQNNDIQRNTFKNIDTFYPGAIFVDCNCKDYRIYNNNIINIGQGITINNNARNFIINANNFYNGTRWNFIAIINSSNHLIENNIFNISSKGIQITGDIDSTNTYTTATGWSENISINHNYFDNMITNFDGWNMAIDLDKYLSNIQITDNQITNYGSTGILVRMASGVEITHNYFNEMSNQNKIQKLVKTDSEIPAAITIAQIYKRYYADGTDECRTGCNGIPNPWQDINYESNYKSNNINIQNNNFGSDVQVFLYIINKGKNVTQDLDPNTYTYRKIWLQPQLMNATELWLNNNFDDVKNIEVNGINAYSTPIFLQGHQGGTNPQIYYSMARNRIGFMNGVWNDLRNFTYYSNIGIMRFTVSPYAATPTLQNQQIVLDIINDNNIKITNTGVSTSYNGKQNLTIYNLAYPYNDIKDSSTGQILASNVDTYSITLAPNQKIEVGNFVTKTAPPVINDTPVINNTPVVNQSSNLTSILPINVTVYLSSPDSTINSDLTCNYFVSGNDVGVTVQWYKNNQYVTKGPSTLSKLNLSVNDQWYCLVNISDPYNKTYRSSNNITITTIAVAQTPEKTSSGGGGGGGGAAAPIETPVEASSPINIKPIPVPVSQSGKPELVTNPPINQMKDAVLEQPKEILTQKVSISYYIYAAIILLASLTTILIVKHPRNIPTNSLLQNFIDQSLYAGYSKAAIRSALKTRYSATIINHHLTGEPTIRYPVPVPDTTLYNHATISQLKEYIRHQRLQGFKDHDIKEALLHYGYSNKVLTEVYQFELA